MLKSDIKQKIHIIPMPIFKEFYILISHINSKRKEQVIITYLNEDEEKKLDDNNQITLKRGKTTFHIHMNNVYCYGEVDIRKGSNDCIQIADFDFLDYLGMKGIVIPSDYDYEHHECHSPLFVFVFVFTLEVKSDGYFSFSICRLLFFHPFPFRLT